MSDQDNVLYDDGRFTITTADIQTPTLYYPIADTVGRVRRDIQFAGLGLAALMAGALAIYWDLWLTHERIGMGAVIAAALTIAMSFSILQIDARGFPSRLFIAPSGKVRKIFKAITTARARGYGARSTGGVEDIESSE